jgi:hypothetical protein
VDVSIGKQHPAETVGASRCETLWLAGKGLAGDTQRALVRELLGEQAVSPPEAGRPPRDLEGAGEIR